MPAQVERGRRGDEGSSPRGKGRAFLAGRSGAPGDAPVRSGVESNEDSTIEALRKENARLRKALAGSEAREGAIGRRRAETRRRRTTLERSPDQKDTIRTLRKEITRLNNEAGRRDKQVLQLNKRLDREQQRTESIRGIMKCPARTCGSIGR